MLRRRSARARGYDRLGDLLVSPPAKAAAAVGREENGVAALRSIRCSPRRCPYLKTPVASSVALVVAALLVLTGALFLNGLVGSVRPAHIAAGVAESHADASGATRLRRGKRSKQKAVTSSFHLERPVGAESSHDEFHVSSWVWLSKEERERGFSLRHSAPGGLLRRLRCFQMTSAPRDGRGIRASSVHQVFMAISVLPRSLRWTSTASRCRYRPQQRFVYEIICLRIRGHWSEARRYFQLG